MGPDLQLEGWGDVEKAADSWLEAQGPRWAWAVQGEGLQEGGEKEEELRPCQALPEADTLTWRERGDGTVSALLTPRHGEPAGEQGPAQHVPKEKGKNASCFWNRPSASRNRSGLNSSGCSKTSGSHRTEPRRGKTSVPCGEAIIKLQITFPTQV